MSFESFKDKIEAKWTVNSKKVSSAIYQEEKNRFLTIYLAYMNKNLVWATWALAVATMLLAGLTLLIEQG